MKKRFWTVPLMMLAVVCSLVLAGCGGPSAESVIKKDLDGRLSQLTAQNEELIAAAEKSSPEFFEQTGVTVEEFLKTYLEGYAYKIGEITVDDKAGTAVANATLKLKTLEDLTEEEIQAKALEALGTLDFTSLSDEKAVAKAFMDVAMDLIEQAQPQDIEIPFNYEKAEDGSWKITQDSAESVAGNIQGK